MPLQLLRSNFEDLIALGLVILAVRVRFPDSPAYPRKQRVAFEERGLDVPAFQSVRVLGVGKDGPAYHGSISYSVIKYLPFASGSSVIGLTRKAQGRGGSRFLEMNFLRPKMALTILR